MDDRRGTRNAPALVNLAWGDSFFWDGRAATLEEQAGKPIEHPDEMDLPLADAVARVAADARYAQAFDDAYGGPVTEESLRQAIASFVRVLVSGDSPYDRHLRGDDAAFGDARAAGRGDLPAARRAAASTATRPACSPTKASSTTAAPPTAATAGGRW